MATFSQRARLYGAGQRATLCANPGSNRPGKVRHGVIQRLILLLLLFAVSSLPVASALEAGAAKIEITPTVGVPLTGYGDRMGRSSTGVHDPLWARALYLTDGETPALIVNTDLCFILPELRERVLALVPSVVPPENVFLTATHTHSGPGAMSHRLLTRLMTGRYMPEVIDRTAEGIAEAMRLAVQQARRASIGYATAKQEVLSRNRSIPDGPIDEQIGVIRVDDADGASIAIVTNFAAHPTSVPSADGYAFSADYPGFYYDEIERLASPGCIALFLNGAEGDQTIANPENKSGWARTESVGRLLAVRAKGAANKIVCGDATLHVGHLEVDMPPTLAGAIVPTKAILKTLEINDLLLTFLPGEPCVSIAHALRQRALARGYGAQFTVGLANDYLLYFTGPTDYRRPSYEAAISLFGPGMEDWFCRQFEGLMTRGVPPEADPLPDTPVVNEVEGVRHVILSGPPRTVGRQRGLAFAAAIKAYYEAAIVAPVRSGDYRPALPIWSWLPAFIDPTPVLLPLLAGGARPRLGELDDALLLELEGMAEGAGMPFDAVWLAQNAHEFALQPDSAPLFDTPLCTMFAVVGDRAGADRLFVGRNLDWAREETPVVTEVYPEKGRAFLQIDFPWHVGTFTGMNDAGLVICAERSERLGPPNVKASPLGMVLRDVLAVAKDVDAAIEVLRLHEGLSGYHVLLASPGEGTPSAAVVMLGETLSVRLAGGTGLLTGSDPRHHATAPDARLRYARVEELLADERIIGRNEIEGVLSDTTGTEEPMSAICNERTRFGTVFEPGTRTVYVAVPHGDGRMGPFTSWRLKTGGAP